MQDYWLSMTERHEVLYAGESTDPRSELNERVLLTRKRLTELEGSLGAEYPAQALGLISRRFEEISLEYRNYTIVIRNSFYELFHRSAARLKSAQKIAQSAKKLARLFEKYSRAPASYSRVDSRLQINELLAELQNLSANTREPSEESVSGEAARRAASEKIGEEGSLLESKQPVRQPPTGQAKNAPDEVEFTAFYPAEGRIDAWHTLLVYAHLVSAIEAVHQDTNRFRDELLRHKESRSTTSTPITRGTEITVIPFCEGVKFNPPQRGIEWWEDYHRLDFRFRADKSLSQDVAQGYITIMVGPVIVGTLKFSMLFSSMENRSSAVCEEHCTMYDQERIFISYSHKDTELVLAFKKVHEATGFDVLIDIDDLRSGQEWNAELMRMIDRADIFQLFWSENSRKSKYCRQEWKHALSCARPGFVRPVYWQKPMPNPPKELSKYHFAFVDL